MRMRLRRSRRPPRPPRLHGRSINRMLPNILTMLALCAGMTAIRFALLGRWGTAVLAILIAAVLDGLDGRVARLLGCTTKLGAQLDSLSDFVSFGVAPAIMLYLWAMHSSDRLGWIAVLTFSTCAALRLARFNTHLGDTDLPPYAYKYFTGVPTPAGAGLALLPLLVSLQFVDGAPVPAVAVALWTIAVGALEISTLPTFSMKGLHVHDRYIVPVLVGVGLLAAFLVSAPWLTLSLIGIIYLASLPFSLRQFKRLQRAATQAQVEARVPEPMPVPPDSAPLS